MMHADNTAKFLLGAKILARHSLAMVWFAVRQASSAESASQAMGGTASQASGARRVGPLKFFCIFPERKLDVGRKAGDLTFPK